VVWLVQGAIWQQAGPSLPRRNHVPGHQQRRQSAVERLQRNRASVPQGDEDATGTRVKPTRRAEETASNSRESVPNLTDSPGELKVFARSSRLLLRLSSQKTPASGEQLSLESQSSSAINVAQTEGQELVTLESVSGRRFNVEPASPDDKQRVQGVSQLIQRPTARWCG